jgi:hypothetical protein
MEKEDLDTTILVAFYNVLGYVSTVIRSLH